MFGSLKNKISKSAVLNMAFAVLAIVSLYYAFKDKNLAELGVALKSANYLWLLPVVLSGLIGSFARALRWKLLLKASGYETRAPQTFFTLMYGYFVNIGTPRLGEFARCAALQETAKVPFAKSFGTVFIERSIDLVCLFLVLFLAFSLQAAFLGDFFFDNIYTPINNKTNGNANAIFIILTITTVLGLLALLLIVKWLNKNNPSNKIILFIKELIEGITSIFRLKQKMQFLVFTALIWFSYFLTSYLWFFAFEATENLTVAAAFTVMAVGAVAKSLPIQGGGLGAYHFLVGQLLLLYQLNGVSGLAYATLNHGTQLVYQIVLGSLAFIWLITTKRKASKTL